MRKIAGWLAIILGAVALLGLGLIVFLKLYLTTEVLTSWVRPPLERYLHREVSMVQARLGLRGVHAEGLEIRKKGANAPLIKSPVLDLRWKLSALLRGKIEIDSLAFTGPEITLVREEDGSLNIADLFTRETPSESAGTTEKRAEDELADLSLFVSLLAIRDGSLTLVDRARRPQKIWRLSNIQSRISALSTSAPVFFQVEGRLEDRARGAISLEGTIDLEDNTFKSDLNLKEVDLPSLMSFISPESASIIQQGRVTLSGSLSAEGAERIKAEGNLNLAGLRMEINGRLSKPLQVEAGFQIRALHAQQRLKIDSLDLQVNGQKAEIHGLLTKSSQRPHLKFTLTSSQTTIDELMGLLHAQPTPLGGIENMPQQSPEQKTMSPDGDHPSYRSTGVVGERSATGVPTISTSGVRPFPFDANGEIYLDWCFYDKLVARNVNCRLVLRKGKLQVEHVSAYLYGGGLKATLNLDMELPGPPFQASITTTKNVLLDEVVAALLPANTYRWTGNVNLSTRARGRGNDLSALESRTDFTIQDAEFSGHPLLQKLAELFQVEDLRELHFSRVAATLHTRRGVATIRDLNMIGPVAQAKGGGNVSLLNKRLTLSLLLRIPAQYTGKLASLRERLPQITDSEGFVQVPIHVSGTLDAPEYSFDRFWLEKTIQQAAKEPPRASGDRAPQQLHDKPLLDEGIQVLAQ